MRGYNFLAAAFLALMIAGCGSTPIPDPEPDAAAQSDIEGRGSASSGIDEDEFGAGEAFGEDSPDGE
ncbi:MAG: hypothetical protein ACREIV_10320, partial [Planctomycetaceae bacterium]